MAIDNDAGDQLPLHGVTLCCTSLAQDVRTKIANVATQMGAIHKLDLTTDVTHLLVGDIATAKYRYVAKERPDIRALSPDFIDAVRQSWMEGGDVDVDSLEKQYAMPTFHGLQVCLTGFEDLETRKQMEDTIQAQGGTYNRDLTKQVTHLVAAKPEGAKYTYAKLWGIHVVGARWFNDCLLRGMALEESYYPPELPVDKQGIGAFVMHRRTSLGKRERDDEPAVGGDGARRKLRKVASMRLDSQSRSMWNDMSQSRIEVDTSGFDAWNDDSQTLRDSVTRPPSQNNRDLIDLQLKAQEVVPADEPQGLFAGHYVMIHGFESGKALRLQQHLEPNGATVVKSAEELEAASEKQFYKKRCLLMPHAQPVALPAVPAGTILVTEWWVERCLHHKQGLDPEQDTLSSPLSDSLIPAFAELTISTTGFDSVDLRQTAEVVKLTGAKYQEALAPSTSILICAGKQVKKEKAFYAKKHDIPVVSPDWLWRSLKTKKYASVEPYRIQLPADDPSNDFAGSPAASFSHQEVSQPRASHEPAQRLDDIASKRLSNTRRRRATPSLILKAPAPTASAIPQEQSRLISKRGPFIHEDEDNDENPTPAQEDAFPTLAGPHAATPELQPNAARPLREISPNASRNSEPRASQSLEKDTDLSSKPDLEAASINAVDVLPKSPRRSPRKNEEYLAQKQQDDLDQRLASLYEQRKKASHLESVIPEPQKRKHRPLGRNPSATSTLLQRTASAASASPSLPSEIPESTSVADGFDVAQSAPVLPPSTQLGYETAEVEAHRVLMAKKMGTSLGTADGGKRVANIATVKDSEDISARSAKAAAAGRAKRPTRNKT